MKIFDILNNPLKKFVYFNELTIKSGSSLLSSEAKRSICDLRVSCIESLESSSLEETVIS